MGRRASLEVTDTAYARLVAEDIANPGNPLLRAQYLKTTDAFSFGFQNGLYMRVPRRLIQGLADVEPGSPVLSRITILGPGSGVAWDDIDIAFNVETLIQGSFGSKAWMSQLARSAGSVKTAKKSASSRENGKRGGRPNKAA